MLRFLRGVGCAVSLSPLLLGKGLLGGSLELPVPISKQQPPPGQFSLNLLKAMQ